MSKRKKEVVGIRVCVCVCLFPKMVVVPFVSNPPTFCRGGEEGLCAQKGNWAGLHWPLAGALLCCAAVQLRRLWWEAKLLFRLRLISDSTNIGRGGGRKFRKRGKVLSCGVQTTIEAMGAS